MCSLVHFIYLKIIFVLVFDRVVSMECCAFNCSTLEYKTEFQFYKEEFRFPEYFIRTQGNEYVQGL